MPIGEAAEVSAERVQAALEKILVSRGFVHSQRLRRFLRFTVEAALDGRADRLKEYLLGVEVFDRKSSYDPRIEPIVRVEARRLRSKLKRYYEAEGGNDPVWIEFPKGSYVPVFKSPAVAAPQAASERPSIAVLPFVNLSAEQENEYFSDGLTEELVNTLTKVEGVRVVAAVQLKGKGYDIARIGRELEVASVLEGSVRRSGDRLRITAQLVNAADGAYLWSETYERKMKDVFAIQDGISQAIVDTLRVRLVGPRSAPLLKRYTQNLEAYHLYLKGRHCWNRQTGDGLRKAIEYFEQAISEDPNYASAYAGLSDSYNLLAVWGAVPPKAVREKANAAARKALEIDELLSEAHAADGANRAVFEWDWTGAERAFQRAIELNPRNASARHGYAMLSLAPIGRLGEAIDQMHRAQEVDPLSLFILTSVGIVLYYDRQYEAALEQFGRAIELEPNYHLVHWSAGRVYAMQGKLAEALAAFERARVLSDSSPVTLGALGFVNGASGRFGEAHRLIGELEERSRRSYVSPFPTGLIYLGLGQPDRAFEWLEKAYEERDAPLKWLGVDPAYEPVRADPRFVRLLAKVRQAA